MQIDAEPAHQHEGGGEHQRDRQRDDGAGAQAKAEEADDEDDGDGLGEHAHEQPDRVAHDARLVGDLRELDADRQVGAQPLHRPLEAVAEADHVAARRHRHAESDRLASAETHRVDGRVDAAAKDPRDVAQAQHPPTDVQPQRLDLAYRIELAGHAQRHRMRGALHGSGRCDDVLRLQLRGDALRVQFDLC